MNKYQEAISSITFTLHLRVKPKVLGHCEDENLDLLQELVDKATPKKPKVVPEFYDDGITDDARYIDLNYCDTCGSLLTVGKCCSNNDCRQAIDWSKDET